MDTNFEQKVLEILTGVQSDIGGLKRDVVDLKSEITGMKDDIAGLKSDVVGLKSDVAGMKGDIVELKNDMAGVKGDIVELKNDMAGVKTELKIVKKELRELSQREEKHYNMLQQSIGDAFEAVKILDQKKLDRSEVKRII